MAKANRESQEGIVKVQPSAGTPSYLDKYVEHDDSLAIVKEYRIVPRIKVVQSLSGEEFKSNFNDGDIVVHPGGILLSACDKKTKTGKPFLIVPIFPFTEFCLWSDRRDKASKMIQDRSFDKTSPLAHRARNEKLRFEVYGDQNTEKPLKRRYVEHLNFVCCVYGDDNPDKGLFVALSFSRGEFSRGKRFCTDLSNRKRPTWSQVWAFQPVFREFGENKWYGMDNVGPTEAFPYSPFIKEEEVDFFHDQYEELKTLHASRLLGVTDDEAEVDTTLPDIDAKM